MKWLCVLLIVGGLTGDKPSPNIQSPDPLPVVGDERVVRGQRQTFNPDTPLKEMRVQKCNGSSVFETATVLVQKGYNNPYTGEDCGIDINSRLVGETETRTRTVRGRSVVGRLEDGGKGRMRLPSETTTATKFTPTGHVTDTSFVDSLADDCWYAFIRYMGVQNWRNIPVEGPYPPFDQPGILRPVSNLVFIPNSRWESFKCAGSGTSARTRDFSGRKRRYIGTEGFILEEKRGKGENQKYQDIIDYIDSKIAELEGGTAEQDVQSQMRTSYQTTTGMVDNQGTYRQGAHSSNDTVTLVDGEATVDINTRVDGAGRSDQSFLSSRSYRGYVTTKDTSNANTYRLIPMSGKRFRIISSDSTDTATVHFKVEGQ